ncbi:hypothetical protein F5Y10DRAFT_171069 [Nemania abortiva]|nr:hypothetical protein F5Y10DRAFT_171069 [Nemania abortiva]
MKRADREREHCYQCSEEPQGPPGAAGLDRNKALFPDGQVPSWLTDWLRITRPRQASKTGRECVGASYVDSRVLGLWSADSLVGLVLVVVVLVMARRRQVLGRHTIIHWIDAAPLNSSKVTAKSSLPTGNGRSRQDLSLPVLEYAVCDRVCSLSEVVPWVEELTHLSKF